MQICGRDYEVVNPQIRHEKDRRRSGNRIHVVGLTNKNGLPIRFKSVERAERHIKNMGLEK